MVCENDVQSNVLSGCLGHRTRKAVGFCREFPVEHHGMVDALSG